MIVKRISIKKVSIFNMAVLLLFSLIACGRSESRTSEDTTLQDSIEELSRKPEEAEEEAIESVYAAGDIILSDGSVVRAENLTAVDGSNLPMAVIAVIKEDGAVLGVGVHRSGEPLQWAFDDTTGYMTNFTNIACAQNDDFTFNGDTDGSDNWDVICAQDEAGTADDAENYPAFHFVNTYAETYNLTGIYASGWYMPSIPELCDIYQNREVVNVSLQKVYELDNKAAMNGLDTTWYWASSQSGTEDDYAWFVHYFNGYAGECPKNFTNVHALAVRTF